MKSPISLLSARVKCSSSVTSLDSSLESSYSEIDFRTTQRSHLLRYSNNHEHEGETFQCQGCDFKTTQWASYMTHIKSHQSQRKTSTTFPCPDCDYKTRWKNNLQMHIKAIHKHDKGETVPCPYCDFKAKAKGNLQMHIKFCIFRKSQCHQSQPTYKMTRKKPKTIHKGYLFSCPDCDYKAQQKSHLQIHIKSIHKGETFQSKI